MAPCPYSNPFLPHLTAPPIGCRPNGLSVHICCHIRSPSSSKVVHLTCVLAGRPKRKRTGIGSTSEAAQLVRLLLRKADDEKHPLTTTLNKHVRTIRTKHCFLLFEELGKRDNWLQCIEGIRLLYL